MSVDRHRRALDELISTVCGGGGELDSVIRRALVDGKGNTGALGAFAIKVAQNPTSIGDEQIQQLRRAGYSEDAIFECILAASLGAGMERLRAGLRAMGIDDESR